MEKYFEVVRKVLIPMFYKEAMLGRSIELTIKNLKKIVSSCIELANKVDNGI
jgi:hypothetical protein